MVHLHHVYLFSQDLDATVAWYKRAFDAEVYYDGDFGGSRNVFLKIGSGIEFIFTCNSRATMAQALSTILEFVPKTSLACVTVCYRWEPDLGAEFANSAHGATSCVPRQTRYSSSCSKSRLLRCSRTRALLR